MQIDQSIIDAWPFDFEMRPTQQLALGWLQKNKDKKYFVMQVPVGGGKSFIGMTFARMLDQTNNTGFSYIMTPQVLLQKQYMSDFSAAEHSVDTLYGKSRYTCLPKKTTCDVGAVLATKKPKCHNCPYRIALSTVPKTKNLVINYTAALTHFLQNTEALQGRRSLIIADECHTLEHQLTEFDSFSINGEFCQTKLKIKWIRNENDPFEVYQWIKKEYLPALANHLAALTQQVQTITDSASDNLSPDDISLIKEKSDIERKMGHISIILNSVAQHTSNSSLEDNFNEFHSRYILIDGKLNKRFKARSGARAFKSILQPRADKFLLMSSTIIDHNKFCEDLGIDTSEAAFFDIDSEFKKENRLIYRIPTTKMDRTWKDPSRANDRERMIDSIVKIADLHSKESGIIHTANFEISDWVVKELEKRSNHKIYHHNDDRFPRERSIRSFLNEPNPAILVSPSCTEGLDLKNDLGRFAIFAKIPYPFLGDQWIKAKCDESQEWYSRQAIINVIQGSGRVVRSKDDYGSIYILDDLFDRLYRQWNRNFPDWWKESVVYLDSNVLTQ